MTYKNREMATGPFPVAITRRAVRVTSSCSAAPEYRIAGHHAMIRLSDESEVACCAKPYGHKQNDTLVRCATAKVAALNEAAGIPEDAR